MSSSIDGKGQKAYWDAIRKARQRRYSGPVGALYIRPGETEKQARHRIATTKSSPTPSSALKS